MGHCLDLLVQEVNSVVDSCCFNVDVLDLNDYGPACTRSKLRSQPVVLDLNDDGILNFSTTIE